jgi:6-phosphogluconolactonase
LIEREEEAVSERPRFTLKVVPSAAEVAAMGAKAIARALGACRSNASSRVSLVLAGGTTPRAVYELLDESAVDGVDFFFGDERAVPPDHPESNYRMAKLALFDRLKVAADRIHRMPADAEDRDAAARAYESELPDPVDVLVLGMGEDAHTASLFPESSALEERIRRVLPITGPKPPPERLTITPVVVGTAKHTIVLITGAGKADALERAILGPFEPSRVPIQLASNAVFVVDAHAASKLPFVKGSLHE